MLANDTFSLVLVSADDPGLPRWSTISAFAIFYDFCFYNEKYYHCVFFILIFIGDQAIKKKIQIQIIQKNSTCLGFVWSVWAYITVHIIIRSIQRYNLSCLSLMDQACKLASIRHKRWSLRVVFLTKNPTKVFDFTKSCKMS